MRRPTPLPSPPGEPDSAPPRTPSEPVLRLPPRAAPSVPSPEAPLVAADATATAPILPLLGFVPDAVPEERRPAEPAVDDPARSDDRADEDDADRPVGWREVWRAARARRRAMRAEVRRFTTRQRRRRAVWLGVAGGLVLLIAGSLAAAYSPLFAVEEVTVLGARQLDPQTVAGALSPTVGMPLPLVDESAIKAALVRFPLVESYTLEARPPHELVVRIVERTPVGVIASPAGYTLVDAAGVALATTLTAPAGYPILSVAGGLGSDAFTAAGTVMRSLPADLRARVAQVTASSPDDVAFTLNGDDVHIVWGSAEKSARKAIVLEKAMVARPPAQGTTYDVSSPDAVVVR